MNRRLPSPADSLTYVGHATVLLELAGARLLTDPLLRAQLGHIRRQVAAPASRVTEEIDAVLISHLHFDHLDFRSLRAVGAGVRVIGPRGSQSFLRNAGFRQAVELPIGETTGVGHVQVTAVPAEHDGHRRPYGARAEAVGFEVHGGERRVYFAGDTDLFPGMADLAGRLDVALLPVWGWGTRLGPGHLDPERAADAAALLRPRVAIPIHWGTYFPLGQARRRPELLRDPPRQFAAAVEARAPDVEVQLLEPGQAFAL